MTTSSDHKEDQEHPSPQGHPGGDAHKEEDGMSQDTKNVIHQYLAPIIVALVLGLGSAYVGYRVSVSAIQKDLDAIIKVQEELKQNMPTKETIKGMERRVIILEENNKERGKGDITLSSQLSRIETKLEGIDDRLVRIERKR